MPARKHVAPDVKIAAEDGRMRSSTADETARSPRAALYARVYRAAQAQMDTLELVQKTLQPTQPAQAERTARVTATLNKTLLEIAALARPDEGAPPDEADDDPVPRDIDEFRRELARRIRGFVEARRNRAAGFSSESEGSLG